jgi:hypothetical protein
LPDELSSIEASFEEAALTIRSDASAAAHRPQWTRLHAMVAAVENNLRSQSDAGARKKFHIWLDFAEFAGRW